MAEPAVPEEPHPIGTGSGTAEHLTSRGMPPMVCTSQAVAPAAIAATSVRSWTPSSMSVHREGERALVEQGVGFL